MRRWGSLRAALVFFAFTAPLGIVAHLTSELAGLGWQDDAEVAFSARHAYLAAVALISLAGLFLALRNVPPRDRRARIEELISSLPFGGRGLGFTVASFVAQFGFFAVTQIGEGCPLCGGDVATGMLAAAVAAAIGAVAVALGKRRFIAFALACVYVSIAARRNEGVARAFSCLRTPRPRATRRTPFAFRYRPPPQRAEYAAHLTV